MTDEPAPGATPDPAAAPAATPHRRFLRAYGKKDRWVIWYEHGGRGYHRQTLALLLDSRQGWMAEPWSGLSGDLCRATQALFEGVTTAGDR